MHHTASTPSAGCDGLCVQVQVGKRVDRSKGSKPSATEHLVALQVEIWHAPVPGLLYLSRLSESLPLAVTSVSRAASLTAEAAGNFHAQYDAQSFHDDTR